MIGDRIFRFSWCHLILVLGAILLTASLLSHGTSGGDESGVLSFLPLYDRGGWDALLSRFPDNSFLAHRLFWLIEKWIWEGILHAALPERLFVSPPVNTWWLVLDGPLLMAGAFALLVSHLLWRGHHWSIAILAPSAVLISSSAIGLFTGGFSECLMGFLVAALVTVMDRDRAPSVVALALFAACSVMLVFTKLYAAPFVFLLCFALPRGTGRLACVSAMGLAPFVWLILQSKIAGTVQQGSMLSFYLNLMSVLQPGALLIEVFRYFFSLSFGILPCFPLLIFTAWSPVARNRALLLKIAGLLCVMAVTLPFGFWYGPGGLGGPRYIAPFLLILVPEIAAGMARLATSARGKHALLLVPAAALLFLPAIEFRNSLVSRYSNGATVNDNMDWSHSQPEMHPAIFGWRVAAAKLQGAPSYQPSSNLNLRIPTDDIFPMTGLSRIVYVLDRDGKGPGPAHAAWLTLKRMHMANAVFWRIVRIFLAALLLGIILMASLKPEPSR